MNEKKRILLCYFGVSHFSYTPTDIGYIVAILEQKFSSTEYIFDIVQLDYELSVDRKEGSIVNPHLKYIERSTRLIEYYHPYAVFFFLENVLWSKVFALGRTKSIAKNLRSNNPKLFIGLQSFKIQQIQIDQVLDNNLADCIIIGDPEELFLKLSEILLRMPVIGVRYQKQFGEMNYKKQSFLMAKENVETISVGSLDRIPSPYLNHTFDNFLQSSQIISNGHFRAFLVSSRGCRFGCYYCFRSTKFEKIQYFSAKRFYDELEYLFNTFRIHHFFVLDDAFIYSRKRLEEFEHEFQTRLNKNPDLQKVDLFVMARPESINEEIVKILKAMNVKYIQIGLQTVNPSLQVFMRRRQDVVHFVKIREWLKKYNILLHLDVVIGLPGDSVEWMKETMRYVLLMDPFSVQIKQFYLGPNTLFSIRTKEYNIKIDDTESSFNTPYVISANNIDDQYFTETNHFIMNQIKDNPQIRWKYLSKKQSFISGLSTKISSEHETSLHNEHRGSDDRIQKYFNVLWHIGSSKGKNSVYVVTAVDDQYAYIVSRSATICMAIDQLSGCIVWKFEVFSFQTDHISPYLKVSAGKVYFRAVDRNLYCLDAKNGNRLWVFLEENVEDDTCVIDQYVHCISIVTSGGLFTRRKKIVTLDMRTGKKRWEHFISIDQSIALIHDEKNHFMYIREGDRQVSSVQIENHKLKWTHCYYQNIDGQIVIDQSGKDLFFLSTDGKHYSIKTKDGSTEMLFQSRGFDKQSILFVYNEYIILYSCNKGIQCIHLKTGMIRWIYSLNSVTSVNYVVLDASMFIYKEEDLLIEIDIVTGMTKSCFSLTGIGQDSILIYSEKKKRFFLSMNSGDLFCFSRQMFSHLR